MIGKAFMNRSSSSDFYQTPYSMTRALLEREYFDFRSIVLEPAAGERAMVKVLRENFQYVIDSDISDPDHTDFLEEEGHYPYVITNPPYKLADAFVERARRVALDKWAFLLRTNFLSGQQRLKEGRFRELSRVYVFSRMSDLRAPLREDGKYPTAGIVYAWFIWQHGWRGAPRIHFIDNSKYVLRKADVS